MPAALTRHRWQDLLAGVKAKLGEGKVNRFSIWRSYCCQTSTGNDCRLALGSWPTDDDSQALFPYVEVKSQVALPGELRLGDNASLMMGSAKGWKEVPDVESEFSRRYRPICTEESFARAVLSKRARSIIENLERIPPQGITVLVKRRSIVIYKNKPVFSVEGLAQFLNLGRELADTVL